ncbi:lipopolysaccharide biosynthesis protein [Clostridium butyricum]|uniref:lipopolysaccharide biosynthesis protein n=1 Tax=Clostridium butyricum TaxID=1492 RepID=UPI0002CCC212|nr:lipopolysaccharide biosynthesis protein [Clostridium butyricum]EMU55855.1 hypothetical protein CBDKU1_01970 [Clostridium butyricum DKU-01]
MIRNLIGKYSKLSTPLKASLAFMIVSFFQKGMSIITGPIFTRILSPTEYGQISIFNSWIDIIGVVAMLSLSAGVYNNGMLDYEDKKDEFTFSLLILSNSCTLIMAMIYIIFRKYFDYILILPHSLIILMFIIFFISPAFNFWTTRQRYEYKYKSYAVITILSIIISCSTSILCVINFKNKIDAKLWGEKIILILIWIYFYINIIYKGKFKLKLEYWKYALKFNIPLIPHYLSLYVLNNSDRVMIANILGTESAAIYSVAYSAGSIVSIIWISINSSLLPWTYDKLKKKEYNSIGETTKPLIVIYGVVCVMLVYLAPEIMHILAPKSYHNGIYVIAPVIAGIFFTSLYCLFANIEFYYKSTKVIMIASVMSSIINIILNLIFIPRYGYIAAGYTTLISYIFQSILHYINLKRIEEKTIYDIKFVIYLSICVIVMCLLSNILYSLPFLRYGILICAIVIIFKYKNKFIKLLKSIREK